MVNVAEPRLQSACLDEQKNIRKEHSLITSQLREKLLRQRPVTLWLTGLSGAGKSSISFQLEKLLVLHHHACVVLDGDNLRHGLNIDLGFSAEHRRENIRRAACVSSLMNDAGLIVIASFISPYAADRKLAEEIIGEDKWVEVFVDAPLSLCEQRDVKGLYAKARLGQIKGMTGIDAPYERPLSPHLIIETTTQTASQSAEKLFDYLTKQKIID